MTGTHVNTFAGTSFATGLPVEAQPFDTNATISTIGNSLGIVFSYVLV